MPLIESISPRERAEVALLLVLRCPEAERVDALQHLQQLAQAELVRLWEKCPGMPTPGCSPVVQLEAVR